MIERDIYMLGERLSELRHLFHMSQKDVSEVTGLSTQLIGKYENNTAKPSLDMVSKFAALYCTSTDYLLGRHNRKTIVLDKFSPEKQKIIQELVQLLTNYYHEGNF